MKITCLLLLISISLQAQQNNNFKQYVDTLNGFSISIPRDYAIVKNIDKDNQYIAHRYGSRRFDIKVEPKSQFYREYNWKLSSHEKDTLLAISKINCLNTYHIRANLVDIYNRIDSLIQWNTKKDIRIIEFQRTEVVEHPDNPDGSTGRIFYEKVGPIFFVQLNPVAGDLVITFDFLGYIYDGDIKICRDIVTSINLIE